MNNFNNKNQPEDHVDGVKQYGQKSYENTKDVTKDISNNIKDPNLQHRDGERTKETWEQKKELPGKNIHGNQDSHTGDKISSDLNNQKDGIKDVSLKECQQR